MVVLPDDVMIDILLKVGEENHLPLRCVCRNWKSLIEYPYFMYAHIRRAAPAIFEALNNAPELFMAFKV